MGKVTLYAGLRSWPCQSKAIQRLFKVKVSMPSSVVLPLNEIFELIRTTDILQGKRTIKLTPVFGEGSALKYRKGEIVLNVETLKGSKDLYYLPVDQKAIGAELEKARHDLYPGRKFYHDLLEIDLLQPDNINLGQAQSIPKEPLSMSSGENLLRGVFGLTTDSIPHETIREMLDPDFSSVVKALSEDHPAYLKRVLHTRKFASVLLRQNHECLKQLIQILSAGVMKLERIFEGKSLRSLYPFLPEHFRGEIAEVFSRNNQVIKSDEACQDIDKWYKRLPRKDRREVDTIFGEAITIVRSVLESAKGEISRRLEQDLPGDETVLRNLLMTLHKNNLFEVLPHGYTNAIVSTISESRRAKLIRDIKGSNFLNNVKELLIRILNEKKAVSIAMYSFTSPLFAAASIAAALRGAKVKILLDPAEAKQESSQYENFIKQAEFLANKFGRPIPLEVRLFRGTQHLKNILLASHPIATSGSQNLSERGLTRQLEDVTIFEGRSLYDQKLKEFDAFFSMSGSFIPFPEQLAHKSWVRRSGIQGIEFAGRPPSPAEISSIFDVISRMRSADFTKVPALFALLHEKGAEFVIDLSKSFGSFLSAINNPEIVETLLPSFLKTVPQYFSFAAASSSGKMHPGTTSGLAGLIEHVNITCELAVKICRMLGREDLADPAILATIAHDTYKNAFQDDQGNIVWGRYNPSHGQLAAKKLSEIYFADLTLKQQQSLSPIIGETLTAIGEHMSIFNEPTATPLVEHDPALKFAMVLADMLASRKYLYVNHRASLPYEKEEILHLLLNNSFSLEGEALSQIQADQGLFTFVQNATPGIKDYSDLPSRTKQILRVTESLCDLFPACKEVFIKKGAEPTTEDQARIAKRKEILSAAILLGSLRYQRGIEDPSSKADFDRAMKALVQKYPDLSSRERIIIDLVLEVESRLKNPNEAVLSPKDSPELWILCMANCLMADPDVWIITTDDVGFHLRNAEPPKTIWAKKTAPAGVEEKLAADLQHLVATDYLSEQLPFIETGLLARFNSHRKAKVITKSKLLHEAPEIKDQLHVFFRNPKDENLVYKSNFKRSVESQIANHLLQQTLLKIWERSKEEVPLKKVPPEILRALVGKYNSLSPDYIFEQFYSSRDKTEKEDRFEKMIGAGRDAKACAELVDEIGKLSAPEDQGTSEIYRIAAKTFLANNITTIEQAKETVAAANNLNSISDFSYFKQMDAAVKHILEKADDPEEKICIYGDYDVDGITSTALLVKTLRWIKAKRLSKTMDSKKAQQIAHDTISYYIPNRSNEGYSLNAEALHRLSHADKHGRKVKTIITVDCGIRDKQLVRLGKKLGINFIITDHHTPDRKDFPNSAVAVINPKVDLHPKHPAYGLVGAAVAYKLAQALAKAAEIDLKDSFLDSVALASVADIVPMTGENRAFVKAGLKRINSSKRNKGLQAAIRALKLESIDEVSMAFFMAPLLNVAGRLDNPYKSLKLLISRNEKEMGPLLGELFSLLDDRREIEGAIFSDIERNLIFDPKINSGIAVSGGWDKGVIGLVASKIVQKYGVPAALVAVPDSATESASGSMRTIKGVSAIKVLKLCAKKYREEKGEELFISCGGHSGAAGFRIAQEKIDDFKRIYDEITRAVVKSRKDKMVIAAEVKEDDIKLADVKLFKQLLTPFGSHFEEPRFLISANIKSWQVMGKDHQHLRGYLENGTPFVFFNGNQPWIKRILIQKKARFVVKLGINVYKGRESVQLVVEDLKPAKR